jgi:DNA-binding ferritin-like protein
MKESIILMLLEYQTQIKFLHWNTFGYSTHKSLGDLYDNLSSHIDTFTETMMGKYGRPQFPETFSLEFQKPESIEPLKYMNQISEYLISLNDILNPMADSDLLNMRDEMLADVNQTKYLLTLNK